MQSPIDVSSGSLQSARFRTGSDSPVKADSSALSCSARKSLASAGTMEPAERKITSPGTSSLAGISFLLPSRITCASGAESLRSMERERSALASCTTPSTALMTTMIRIISGSAKSTFPSSKELRKETRAAPSRINIIKSLNCSAKRERRLRGFFPESSL